MVRQSTITKSDIMYLIRQMHTSEQQLVAYGLSGCPKTGFGDDMLVCVELIQLRDAINRILNESKKINGFK